MHTVSSFTKRQQWGALGDRVGFSAWLGAQEPLSIQGCRLSGTGGLSTQACRDPDPRVSSQVWV